MKTEYIIVNINKIKKNIQDFIIFKVFMKSEKYNMIMKSNFKNKYSNIINFILFNIILFSFLKKIESTYIYIEVNGYGLHQILSDDYIGELPNKVYINGGESILFGKIVFVEHENINKDIKLEWDHALSNFSYMFNGLSTITSVYMSKDIVDSSYNINMAYMFKNCVNLLKFECYALYDKSHIIKNIEGMFYNCYLLNFLVIEYFYLGGYNSEPYQYNDVNMAYMFYNCQKLTYINFNKNNRNCNITNSTKMFYNCSSLTSINLANFGFNSNVDLSYMFYNCSKLKTIIMPHSYNNFGISDIYQMFYNCQSLESISIIINKKYANFLYMSQLFYNCISLTNIRIDFQNLYVADSVEMFYNCYSLKSVFFNPYNVFNYNNMHKMFYNCSAIEIISFDNIKLYYNPIDISYMFYNCKELKNLIIKSIFRNDLIKSMKGMFKDLKALTVLNLKNFYTPNVVTMMDMFNGCSNLRNLSIPNFDTSKVIDMESMFEGCSSLISLDIDNFKTTNVQYMNKMFQDCKSLKSLYFSHLTTESLGTMYRMFYNCQNLEYLNLYSLTETGQSIFEMFNKSSLSFELCIKEEEYIPNIFQVINGTSIKRDCSENCYSNGKRKYIENKKSCCSKLIYKDTCYDKCPIRTKEKAATKECEDLNCKNYYTYEQKNCTEIIPDGYFMNDTILKTIDKCHESCKTCKEKPTNISMNCLSCINTARYLYLGNCFSSCLNGVYNEIDGTIKCKCFKKECFKCSEKSLEFGLCETCNENYYPKKDEYQNNSRFINCYHEPEEYYLEKINGKFMYKHCYHSCKYCINGGDKFNHNCTSCNNKNSFSIPFENNEIFNDTYYTSYINFTIMNCYPECMYNYYFDKDYNYTCLSKPGCPKDAILFVEGSNQCVKTCKGLKNKYRFKNKCFFKCPPESIDFWNETGYYCRAYCPIEKPFEMIETQTCVSSCSIMDRYNKLCITNYNGSRLNEIHDMIISSIKDDIIDTFDYNFITNNRSLILEEDPFIYEITSTTCKYVNPNLGKVNLRECENKLKDFYAIPRNVPLYILKVDAFIEGKLGPKVEYEVYCPYNELTLHQLDISICEGIDISIEVPINISIDNIDKYDKNSGFYNDICYTYTNDNGTDVTLEDRQEEYKKFNRSVCDEGCKLVRVDSENNRAECSCGISFDIPFVSEISVDKEKLYTFMNIKNIVNFKIMQCYKLFFSPVGVKENIGFYCLLLISIVYFICLFYFYLKEYKLIKIIINEIVFAKKNEKYLDKEYKIGDFKRPKKTVFISFIKRKRLEHEFIIEKLIHAKNKIFPLSEKINIKQKDEKNKINENKSIPLDKKGDNIDINQTKNETINLERQKKEKEIKSGDSNSSNLLYDVNKIKNAPPIKWLKKANTKIDVVNLSSSRKDLFPPINKIHLINKVHNGQFNAKQKQKIRYILSYIDSELNDLNYKKAIEYDKRTYFQFYFSLLKTNHNFVQIFNNRDYNARSIKILLFFFDFASNYAVNALFFNDDTMHQIYNDGGDFNFIYQLPQIIYSTIISIIIDSIISYLGLSQDDILSVKQTKKVKDVIIRAKEVLRTLHFKFIFFFIVNFIFIILFWYYLGCFCAVYTNTQFHLIKDTLIGVGTGFITPFGKFLAPGIFRIPTLKQYGRGKRLIYLFSQFLQKI